MALMGDIKLKKLGIITANVFALVFIAGALLVFKKTVKPVVLGYYCDDDTIDKPYRPSTIPFQVAGMVYFALAAICFVCVEYFKTNRKEGMDRKAKIKSICLKVVLLLLFYFYGAGITMFITDIGKYTVGRLRPHFFDVCRPDWSKINCTNAVGAKTYIVGDQFCTRAFRLLEARISFPSGHASFSMYCSAFLVLFFERRDNFQYNQWEIMPKLLAQTLIGSSGLYVGLSRISDFKHHLTDVVAGFILGIVVAIIMHISCFKFMPSEESTGNSIEEQPNNDDTESGKLTQDDAKGKEKGSNNTGKEGAEAGTGKEGKGKNIWL